MTTFPFETWDDGRLTVNREFAASLRTMEFSSFASFMSAAGDVAKDLLPERTTVRLSLPGRDGQPRDFYLKRHRPSPLKEYVKPWLRLSRPLLGARHEWNAILQFHAAGIATMTPVAMGEHRGESFLLTEGIANCRKLSEWMESRFGGNDSWQKLPASVASTEAGSFRHETQEPNHSESEMTAIIDGVAELARAMHGQLLHHQDFYLTHLLLPLDHRGRRIHVIDLGRAMKRTRLARRWIVKDLAQLNYSASQFPDWARRRFLERYLGRPLRRSDDRLRRQIEWKTARIARHSAKHRL
jgi:lipopolysaccharide core heptose(I) kinase